MGLDQRGRKCGERCFLDLRREVEFELIGGTGVGRGGI